MSLGLCKAAGCGQPLSVMQFIDEQTKKPRWKVACGTCHVAPSWNRDKEPVEPPWVQTQRDIDAKEKTDAEAAMRPPAAVPQRVTIADSFEAMRGEVLRQVGDIVQASVAAAVKPLHEEIAALKAKLGRK